MAVKIKICGVQTNEIAEAAIEAGADYLGLVFFPPSPRNLSFEQGARLVKAVDARIPTVAVLVDPDDELIDRIVTTVNPDYLQLHGSESPERVAAIKVRSELPVIKAVPVEKAENVDDAAGYIEIADIILFDAKPPKGSKMPGGRGERFDWELLSEPDVPRPFGVSGGLDAGNVLEAMAVTHPDLVDVSSGVESAPGEKDEELVRSFINIAKLAEPEEQQAAQ
ncbi:N-(5'-phosphoribosyl)anthranilate isomerase [Methyloligella halotolerans]|uniref:N-(5'-phosphoribosyl)anthranilate isomerase n=1 Tax=Methyloligella halotolerans TaxID=1177755 RepID=A0A1E2S0D7_9HYPH|nr:phosphoribosylanthranilate isomerase [Methyloligella halotolerans]ODA67785.1 N-(5'-phosphoribosyl)anthranilate isomerase [Methyloligella halotolerans]